VGANLRHVEARLPHLNRLLVRTPEEALEGAEVVLISSAGEDVTAALRDAAPEHVIDLSGRLGDEVEQMSGYSGVGW
jgi:GDP-mannose 6-dehydrogenase